MNYRKCHNHIEPSYSRLSQKVFKAALTVITDYILLFVEVNNQGDLFKCFVYLTNSSKQIDVFNLIQQRET